MNVKSKIIAFSFALFLSNVGYSQTLSYSLQQAQDYAVKNAYQIKMAQIDLENAKKKIWETTAIGLPQVSGNIQYQNIFKVPEVMFGGDSISYFAVLPNQTGIPINQSQDLYQFFHKAANTPTALGVKENWTYTLTATQIIFNGEYLVGLQASRIFYQLSDQALQKSERDIKESVAKSYYLVLVLEENSKIIKENYAILDKTYNDFKAMLQQGLIEETDVDQMSITRSNLANAMTTIESQRLISQRLLKFQLGIPFEQELVLTDSLSMYVQSQANILTPGSGFSIDNNIDFKLMKTNEAAQLLLLKQQQSKVLPSIVAVYRYQGMMKEPAFNFTPKNVLAVQMDIPIFASGSRYVKIQQAKLNLEKTKLQVQQVEQALKLEAEQANADYVNALNTLNLITENLALSKKIYEKTLIKYNTGVSSGFDLNTAQTQYLTTLTNYYSAVINLLNAKQKIEKLKN